MAFERLSPVGRLVGGSPIKGYQDTDEVTKAKLFNDDGTPKMSYLAMLAIEKANPEWAELYTQLWNEGRGAFPHLFDPQTGACHRQDFSWKIIDGDGRNTNGKLNSEKEGYAGCMVLKIESNYPFSCYDQSNFPITDETVVYRGCFIRVAMKCQGNNATGNQKPGIKIYPQALQMIGHGPRISGGPDAATLFAAPVTTGYVPAGMSATPLAGNAPPVQQAAPMQMHQAPAPMQMAAPVQMGQQPQQAAPMQMAAPAMQQAAPMQMAAPAPLQVAQPDQAFVQQALGQQPAMQMAAPVMQQAAPQYQMTAAAGGHSREAWHANGNTDEQLIAAGMMVRIA